VSRVLLPLEPLYRAGIALKNAAYDRGWLTAQRLKWPVISVGNISVGGAGKTPLVIRLAELLVARGLKVDVLSRGYGRSSTDIARVNPEGSAEEFGDEPLLIAQKAGVPVYVGASRYKAGLLAESESPGQGVHLLDDGFQHRKLARGADIVVIHRSDFAQNLLPAGRLREPLSSLCRASVIVLRAEDSDLEQELRRLGVSAPVWIQQRRLVVDTRGPAVAFCGIARPEEFYSGLNAAEVTLLDTRSFRDHHRYDDADIESVLGMCRSAGTAVCLTTEKDAVRLTADQRARLSSAVSLKTVNLEVSLADEASAVEQMLALLVRK
jgi:tetraacyldisaccharide 4'-kinase